MHRPLKLHQTLIPALTLAAALVAPGLATAQAQPWQIETNHSSASFKVKHLMISTVRGHMTGVKGTVALDPKDLAGSSVEATIDASTINTGNARRDKHLRSKDFFDVAKHPTITFKSTKVEVIDDETFKVTGNLTMNGVTKEVVLEVEGPTPPVKNPAGLLTRAFTATTKLNRQDFGISWSKKLDDGGSVVSDKVKIEIDLAVVQLGPKTAQK